MTFPNDVTRVSGNSSVRQPLSRRVGRCVKATSYIGSLTTAAILIAAGSSAASQNPSGQKSPHHSRPAVGATGARARVVPLVVYSAQGYDHAETAAFQKATGIPVRLEDNSTGPLITQIEASKDNPKWGLLWVDGPTVFAGLDSQGLLVRGFEPHVRWNFLGVKSVPKDKSYVPTGVTLTAAVVYNSAKISHPPTTWAQLLSPRWKGKVGMNNPSISGPTYPFVAGMMNYLGGVRAGERFFSKLKANGLVVNQTNGPTLAALSSGQIALALVQSSAGIGAGFTEHSLKVKYLPPITMLPSCIGIDSKAPRAERLEAERFASFVLSPKGQRVMQTGDPTGDSLYYPVLQGISRAKGVPALNGVKTQTINPYIWGRRQNAIDTWFTNNIVQ
ncbi:MAG: ABC transporter substrate-binding protein [Acidimicrobiales bacterium]